MINVVVVSHGNLGEMLIQAAEMIVGSQEGMRAVSLLPEESSEACNKLETDFQGQDMLILLDLFGGMPCNVAERKILQPNVECVTGANMAALIEALTLRDCLSLSELATQVAEAGQKSVLNLKPLLCKTTSKD